MGELRLPSITNGCGRRDGLVAVGITPYTLGVGKMWCSCEVPG